MSVVPLLGVPIDLIYGNCNLSDNWFPGHRSRGFRRATEGEGSMWQQINSPVHPLSVERYGGAGILIGNHHHPDGGGGGDPLTINDLRLWVFLLCFTHPPTEAFQTINCGPVLISHRSHMPPTHQEDTDRRPAAEEAVASVATRPRQQFHWKSSPRRHPVGHPRPPTGQQIRWGSRVHWQSA